MAQQYSVGQYYYILESFLDQLLCYTIQLRLNTSCCDFYLLDIQTLCEFIQKHKLTCKYTMGLTLFIFLNPQLLMKVF